MSLPICIIIPLHANVVTKVVDTTSTPSHHSRQSSYDHRILPSVDVEVEECIKHVSDKKEKEGMKTIGIFTEVPCMVCTMICESNFLLYFHLCPKTSISKVFTMPPSIHFSNLITLFSCMVVFHFIFSIYIYIYSLEHARYWECVGLFFK